MVNRVRNSMTVTPPPKLLVEGRDMPVHSSSSRAFTRDMSTAKRAAAESPVFIADRGRPASAVPEIDGCYRALGQGEPTLLEVMDDIPGGGEIEFEPERLDAQVGAITFDRGAASQTKRARSAPWPPASSQTEL